MQLSKLFGVTTDYLLNDDDERDTDPPRVTEAKDDQVRRMQIFMTTLEVVMLILQFTTAIMMQNTLLGVLCVIPFVAAMGGFEYTYQKSKGEANADTQAYRRKFYQISAWVGTYFPIRWIMEKLSAFYPRPYHTLALEGVVLVIYLVTATLICTQIERNSRK